MVHWSHGYKQTNNFSVTVILETKSIVSFILSIRIINKQILFINGLYTVRDMIHNLKLSSLCLCTYSPTYPHLLTYQPTHPPPTHPSTPTSLSTYPPTHLLTYSPTYPPAYPPIYTYLFTYLSTYLSIHLLTYPLSHLLTHLYRSTCLYLSTHLLT